VDKVDNVVQGNGHEHLGWVFCVWIYCPTIPLSVCVCEHLAYGTQLTVVYQCIDFVSEDGDELGGADPNRAAKIGVSAEMWRDPLELHWFYVLEPCRRLL
jgi:hypothetical protein